MRHEILEGSLMVIPNKFELVVLASQRAYNLSLGSKPAVAHLKTDKVTVIALAEIANNVLDIPALYKDVASKDGKNSKGADDFMVDSSVLDLGDLDESDDGKDDKSVTASEIASKPSEEAGLDDASFHDDVIFDNDVD